MRTKKNDIRNTFRIVSFSLGVIIATAGILNSCKKELPVKPTLSEDESSTRNLGGDALCIEIGGPYFEKPDQKTVNYGPNTKTINIVYYNTETEFVLKVHSTKHGVI